MRSLVLGDLRHRTGSFAGSFVAVSFAALVYSTCALLFTSSLILNLETSGDYIAPIAIFATMGGIAVFAALFVVAATTSLSVMQRRSDMALLRSLGATPRQVAKLVVRETAAVALIASLIGTTAGIPAAHQLAPVFANLDDIPNGFEYRPNWIPIAASIASVMTFAYLAALGAARGAGRTSPAEALATASSGRRGIGPWRWTIGILFAAGTTALTVVSATVNDNNPGLGVGYATMTAMCGIIAVAFLGPVVVRPISWLASLPWRITPIGQLASANATSDAHRTAATATPVALMLSLNISTAQATTAANDLTDGVDNLWSMWILLFISVGFAAIAIVNTTMMTIAARTPQLATTRLAGATPAQVRRASQAEATIATTSGILIGLGLTAVSCWAFATANQLALLDLVDVPLIAALSAGSILLASIAARLTSGHTLRRPDLLQTADR